MTRELLDQSTQETKRWTEKIENRFSQIIGEADDDNAAHGPVLIADADSIEQP